MTNPVMTETTSPEKKNETIQSSPQSFAWYVMVAFGLAIFIRFFIAAPYVVSGASMEHTFNNWDYLITDRFSYRIHPPERGDVIVFCLPESGECSFAKRLMELEVAGPRTLIKRVIGLPGETVSIRNNIVTISNAQHPDGFVLDEPYVVPANLGGPSNIQITLSEHQYFVLGDNRRVSSDSRTWGILPADNIVGHVLIRLFPFSQIGVFPGDASYPNQQ